MSLEDWLNSGWLARHKTSSQEISDLLAAADRDLADCQTSGLSPDWRLNIAHNAVIVSATAALAACGYRASREAQHYRLIQSLRHTIGASRDLINQLDAFRKKRNIGGYERAGAVSEHEADEMLRLAKQLRESLESWLRANHLNLLGR
jgi:hypothetical protein